MFCSMPRCALCSGCPDLVDFPSTRLGRPHYHSTILKHPHDHTITLVATLLHNHSFPVPKNCKKKLSNEFTTFMQQLGNSSRAKTDDFSQKVQGREGGGSKRCVQACSFPVPITLSCSWYQSPAELKSPASSQ